MSEATTKKPELEIESVSSSHKAGELIQQIGLNMLMVGLVALLAFLVYQRITGKQQTYTSVRATDPPAEPGANQSTSLENGNNPLVELLPYATPSSSAEGIVRKIDLKTIIPSRPRVEVITYTVQTGDTLFSIAINFSLKPETLLWGNYEVLNDNPHLLKPKQVLNILPVNGVYYEWQEGDTLDGVAAFFKTDPQGIINYSGNFIDLTQMSENGTGIEPGMWIIIPGGKRAIKDWGPPAITRQNPASARYYGEGACGNIYEGAMGAGTFIWPTTDHSLPGNAYDPSVHPAIDIGGQEGNPIFATDSGVVVYAGWSDYGYGYLIVIDHGNGWQSAYAHLSAVGVSCGQSVYQGGTIGALGSTGNSTGPHLHFELAINGAKVNPLDYVQ
jgi:murein DD-endopeptidase MepM/ murein hydrolase activator NlpD